MVTVVKVDPISARIFDCEIPCAIALRHRLTDNLHFSFGHQSLIGLIYVLSLQVDYHRTCFSIVSLAKYADCAATSLEFCTAILRPFIPAVIWFLPEQCLIEVPAGGKLFFLSI